MTNHNISLLNNEDLHSEVSLEGFFDLINLPENHDKTFELIDGYEVMMTRNTSFNHIRICGYISRKIGNYLEGKKCEVAQDSNIFLFNENFGKCKNIFQPDIIVACDKDKMTDRGYEGTPEFVVEVISKSTAYNDYFVKCARYMQFGVREYWIVDLLKNQILVYLNGGDDPPEVQRYTFNDEIKIVIFEDLKIDFKEILRIVDVN